MSLASYYTPWKYQKTSGFLTLSGGIERAVAWNGLSCNFWISYVRAYRAIYRTTMFTSFLEDLIQIIFNHSINQDKKRGGSPLSDRNLLVQSSSIQLLVFNIRFLLSLIQSRFESQFLGLHVFFAFFRK